MNRVWFLAVLVFGMLSTTAAARVDVAPPPREIRPDGSRDPAPAAAPAQRENPLEVVQRIIKNSNAVGDKLARTDTGSETLGQQATILKDIQSLIDQQDDPPPPKPDQSQDKSDKSDSKDKKDMKQDMPMGGMGEKEDMSPKSNEGKGGMGGMGGMPPPMGGGDQPMGRRPRQQAGKDSSQKEGQPKEPKGGTGGKQQANSTPQQPPKNTGGVLPDPKPGDPRTAGTPLLPIEDEIVKDVWGHLPDKMRQQATQYYQQDFMPRYTELLKLYYSSLAEKGGKK
jgi:hypothetical protein